MLSLRGLVGLAAMIPASLGAQLPRASVEITAKTRDSVPVPGVVIEFTPVGGQRVTLSTDSAGRVSVAGVEPGTARISARKVGFRPGDLRAVLGGGRNTIPLLLDPVAVPVLDEVRILGGREVLARHAEFEGRRSLGLATASITADDIHKRNPVSTWQMLQSLPSIAVNGGSRGAVATSRRSACFLRVIVNGLPLTGPSGGPPNLDDLPPPSDVHGIEVFAGPATIPPQYNSTAGLGPTRQGLGMCGLIAVWTK